MNPPLQRKLSGATLLVVLLVLCLFVSGFVVSSENNNETNDDSNQSKKGVIQDFKAAYQSYLKADDKENWNPKEQITPKLFKVVKEMNICPSPFSFLSKSRDADEEKEEQNRDIKKLRLVEYEGPQECEDEDNYELTKKIIKKTKGRLLIRRSCEKKKWTKLGPKTCGPSKELKKKVVSQRKHILKRYCAKKAWTYIGPTKCPKESQELRIVTDKKDRIKRRTCHTKPQHWKREGPKECPSGHTMKARQDFDKRIIVTWCHELPYSERKSYQATTRCRSTGDPHYQNFFGNRYDFQGHGDFVLAETQDRKFIVHTRHKPWNHAQVNTGMAVMINGKDHFEMHAIKKHFKLNGKTKKAKKKTIKLKNGGKIQFYHGRKFKIEGIHGEYIIARISRRGRRAPQPAFFNLYVYSSKNVKWSHGVCIDPSHAKMEAKNLFHNHMKPELRAKKAKPWKSQEFKEYAEHQCKILGFNGDDFLDCLIDFRESGKGVGNHIAKSVNNFMKWQRKTDKKWRERFQFENSWKYNWEPMKGPLAQFKNAKGMRVKKGVVQRRKSGKGWNTGARSLRAIRSSESKMKGIEFTIDQKNKPIMIGLSHGSDSSHYKDIDYALYAAGNGHYYVYEKGHRRGKFGSYDKGDKFAVYLRRGEITYVHNGKPFYSSEKQPQFPLNVDLSIHRRKGKVSNIRWIGGATEIPKVLKPGQKIYWKSISGVKAYPGFLMKNKPNNKWDSGARSARSFGEDDKVGGISFKFGSNKKRVMMGLSSSKDKSQSYKDIDYAIYGHQSGNIYIYEKGDNRGKFVKYRPFDTFQIQVNDYGQVVYKKNFHTFYTSQQHVQYPLYVDSSIDNSGGSVRNAFWLPGQERTHYIYDDAKVTWKNILGVKAKSGELEKNRQSNSWNAGAVSAKTIEKESNVAGVEFKAAQNNEAMMIGLAYGDSHQSYTDIDYAIYLAGNGHVYVYESGNKVGGSYAKYNKDDTFRVIIRNDQVYYVRNGKTFYTSNKEPEYPLTIDVSIHGYGGKIQDVKYVASEVKPPKENKVDKEVFWKDQNYVLSSPGSIQKKGGKKWHSGARSIHNFQRDDKVGGVRFRVKHNKKRFMFGLSHGDSSKSYKDIDYAIYFYKNNKVYVREKGKNKGRFVPYKAGDEFSVQVNEDGKVVYAKDGNIFYTSSAKPDFPLNVDSSFRDEGAQVYNVKWTNVYDHPEGSVEPGVGVRFKEITGLFVKQGYLRKERRSNSWNAGAISDQYIEKDDEVQGISFKAGQNNKAIMLGLSKSDNNVHYKDIDFAIYTAGNKHFYVYESGNKRGKFGTYKKGDEFTIVYRNKQINYVHNNKTFYTSEVQPEFPLSIDASFYHVHGVIQDIQYTTVKVTPPEKLKPGQPVYWKSVSGIKSYPGYQQKVIRNNGWNSGSFSVRKMFRRSKVGGVTFKVGQTNKYSMIGLSHGDSHNSYTDIDFAIYNHKNDYVYVYEKGKRRGKFHKYNKGDRFDIRVTDDDQRVVYMHNGHVFYTSHRKPQFPLSVDESLHTYHSVYYNVRWTPKYHINSKVAKVGSLVHFKNMDGVRMKPGKLTKTKHTNSWDSGAISSVPIEKDSKVKGISFVTKSNRKSIMVGLSHNSNPQNHHYKSIDFAIYLSRNRHYYVYESGKKKGRMGRYNEKDEFTVKVQYGEIIYQRNGETFHSSQKQVQYPLVADTSFYHRGGSIKEIKFVEGKTSSSSNEESDDDSSGGGFF